MCLVCNAALLTFEELLAEESAVPTARGLQAENRSHSTYPLFYFIFCLIQVVILPIVYF